MPELQQRPAFQTPTMERQNVANSDTSRSFKSGIVSSDFDSSETVPRFDATPRFLDAVKTGATIKPNSQVAPALETAQSVEARSKASSERFRESIKDTKTKLPTAFEPSPVQNRQADDADYQAGRRAAEKLRDGVTAKAKAGAGRIVGNAVDSITGSLLDEAASRLERETGKDFTAIRNLPKDAGDAVDSIAEKISESVFRGDQRAELVESENSKREFIENFDKDLREIAEFNQLQILSELGITKELIEAKRASRETEENPTQGGPPCDYPDQKDSMGRRCGGRAAIVRSGGRFG